MPTGLGTGTGLISTAEESTDMDVVVAMEVMAIDSSSSKVDIIYKLIFDTFETSSMCSDFQSKKRMPGGMHLGKTLSK